MTAWLQSLLFAEPLALWALLALPAIWWLLRTIPPRPRQVAFPPLRILLGLRERETTSHTMPWWLLLLRLLIAALVILAVAHPFTRKSHVLATAQGPLVLVIDDGWAAAKDWPQRQEAALAILNEAPGRVVYLLGTSNPQPPTAINDDDAAKQIRAMEPKALGGSRAKALDLIKALSPAPTEIAWLSNGLDEGSASAFSSRLAAIATTQTVKPASAQAPVALGALQQARGEIQIDVMRGAGAANTADVQALSGDGRVLTEDHVSFDQADHKLAHINLPVELRNTLQSIEIKDEPQAGARALLDDTWRRKTVAILSAAQSADDQPLLSSNHYLETALGSVAELQPLQNDADLATALDSGLSMLILDDVGALPPAQHDAIAAWLDKGGLLVRFAGPHLAGVQDDDLLPVKLREGDRNLGSSLSWETPQTIKPFAEPSPLAGIAVDDHATISRQLLAEPDVDLSAKTWASLADGTPLITSAKHGQGRIVLFHVTANADWSSLPLTGTFEKIMQRLAELAPAAGDPKSGAAAANAEGDFAPHLLLSGSGDLVNPTSDVKSISQKDISVATASPQTPAGLYVRGQQTRAVNLKISPVDLAPFPATLNVRTLQPGDVTNYAVWLWGAAALLYLLDGLAALFLGGHLARKQAALLIPLALLFMPAHSDHARADEAALQDAALNTRLAYVKTGVEDIDQESDAGLKGLTNIVNLRTSAVLADPMAVDIENDEITFFPLLYWPVSDEAAMPSAKALQRISTYMKNGGTIFFDLRQPTSDFNTGGASDMLKRILAGIDVPPLEPVPDGHALTKSFYLLKDFPGRYEGGALWVEAQDDPNALGFDNVSNLLIGSNDYAAAWAVDENGEKLYALIPDDPRQQEFAWRVGVNVVMYVLTGNYKTDQVHVPAILERLGKQ